MENIFYTRLVFGSCSSPKMFDWLSQVICWIAQHNYGINFMLHLLDDFLTIDPPNATAERTMALLTLVFNRLRVPIVPYKTVEPTVQLQYLKIFLDSDRMEARLSDDKLSRIITTLDMFKNKHRGRC